MYRLHKFVIDCLAVVSLCKVGTQSKQLGVSADTADMVGGVTA